MANLGKVLLLQFHFQIFFIVLKISGFGFWIFCSNVNIIVLELYLMQEKDIHVT